jgi:hypothetical protein
MPETEYIEKQELRAGISTNLFVSGTSGVRFRYSLATYHFMRKKLIAMAL